MACVLVCVTAQPSSLLLIEQGALIAKEHGLPLQVLSAVGSGPNLLELPHVAAALDALYARARQVGAEMTMLTTRDPAHTIAKFAREKGASHLVLGRGSTAPGSLQSKLTRELPQTIFHVFDPAELRQA